MQAPKPEATIMMYAQLLGATALMLAVAGPDGMMPPTAEARTLSAQTHPTGNGDALVATAGGAATGRALLGAFPCAC